MVRKIEYLGALEAAILVSHRCTPTHRETVFVREKTKQNEIVWEGPVEVFDIAGHETAKACFAWQSVDERGAITVLTVLENDFINSANRAVQAAIFTDVLPIKMTASLDNLKENLREAERLLQEIKIKVEDWDAAIQASHSREKIRQRRSDTQLK